MQSALRRVWESDTQFHLLRVTLEVDPATITDKFVKYTGENFDGVNLLKAIRGGRAIGEAGAAPT